MMSKETWLIRISGYGTFEFEGTEKEAEEMRAHKHKWERAFSSAKWRKAPKTEVDKLIELREWYFERGGCPSWVAKRIREAKKSEDAKKALDNVSQTV